MTLKIQWFLIVIFITIQTNAQQIRFQNQASYPIKKVNSQTGMFKTKELDEYISKSSQGNFKKHIWGLYILSVWINKHLL